MHHELSTRSLICCFVSVSTTMLWVCSVFLFPHDWVLHALNFVGIFFPLVFYLRPGRIISLLYVLYLLVFLAVHSRYDRVVVAMGVLHIVSLFSARRSVLFSILVEMLARDLCLAIYLLSPFELFATRTQ